MRQLTNWLTSYCDYASYSEAPRRMHFWAGVAAISGALRRRVWLDMGFFTWYANNYLVIVAPPGVVSKSTTTAIAMDLLRKVPGINFGPDVVTWPALVSAFAAAHETFEYAGDMHAQCALTIESSEFGNLVNPQEREMIDLLVSLWDSRKGTFKKVTKTSGNDNVENPWINAIACTTPAWIAGNFPEYIIGGGFTSRCLFIYADTKEKLVAYPGMHMPANHAANKQQLIDDLTHISTLVGPCRLSPAAVEYGEAWYGWHWKNAPKELSDDRFRSYLARKQTHLHKLAMVLAVSQGDSLVLDRSHLEEASVAITELERDMPKVFEQIGQTRQGVQVSRLKEFIRNNSPVSFDRAYRYVHTAFPMMRDFENVVAGLLRAGLIVRDGQGRLIATNVRD